MRYFNYTPPTERKKKKIINHIKFIIAFGGSISDVKYLQKKLSEIDEKGI